MLLTEKLTAIADAVRDKTGGDQPLTLDEIKEQIAGLSTEPEKPYIDSSALEAAYFCAEGQNIQMLSHPNLSIFDAENVNCFFLKAYMYEIPKARFSFSHAKTAKQMFSSMIARGHADYGFDLSETEVDLPCVEDVSYMFEETVVGVLPKLHIGESCRNGSRMFYHCAYLREVDLHEASGIENFGDMFCYCYKATSIHLNMQSATNYRGVFSECGALTDLTIGSLKIRDNDFRLDKSPSLTIESLIGVLEALESNVGEDTTYTVILGSENLAKLTDEQKQIAIDKNLVLA